MIKLCILQQGVWHMPTASMPLAAGYLAGVVKADEELTDRVSVRIENFSGQTSRIPRARQPSTTPLVRLRCVAELRPACSGGRRAGRGAWECCRLVLRT